MDGAEPSVAAVDGLETVLAELRTRHGLDPQGSVDYVNPANGNKKTMDTISAHRDWEPTECPGERLYAQLPDIRSAVAAAMAGGGADTGAAEPEPTPVAVSDVTPSALPAGKTPVTITGTGFVAEATVSFTNGKGGGPTAGPTTFVAGETLQTTVTVQPKGPKSSWDVVVTLPDGRSAACSKCVTVER